MQRVLAAGLRLSEAHMISRTIPAVTRRAPVNPLTVLPVQTPIWGLRARSFAAAASTSYIVLNESEQALKDITQKPGSKVLAYFTATWCGPCKAIAPHFTELADSNKDVTFVKVDVDDNEDTAQKAMISAVPTFIAYSNGKKVRQFSGASIDQLKGLVEDLKQ